MESKENRNIIFLNIASDSGDWSLVESECPSYVTVRFFFAYLCFLFLLCNCFDVFGKVVTLLTLVNSFLPLFVSVSGLRLTVNYPWCTPPITAGFGSSHP